MRKTFTLRPLFRHDLRENYVLSLNKPTTTRMRDLILSVPLSLLVSKGNPGPHFVQRLFCLISISYSISYISYVYVMYFSCKCNVSKILPLVVILKSR